MIRSTHASHPDYVVSAYSDNAAVMLGSEGSYLSPSSSTGEYKAVAESVYNVIKVETVSKSCIPSKSKVSSIRIVKIVIAKGSVYSGYTITNF